MDDPYRPSVPPPEGDGRFRRHRHPRYRFRPLDGTTDRPAADAT